MKRKRWTKNCTDPPPPPENFYDRLVPHSTGTSSALKGRPKSVSGQSNFKISRGSPILLRDRQYSKFLRVSQQSPPKFCPVIHSTNFHRVNSVIWFKNFVPISLRNNFVSVRPFESFFEFLHSLIVRCIILCFVTIPPVRRFCY